ncbi:MAG TPA: helix-turn-helix domain-containing protein [Ilumatobacteraceae bacterium]|nr:helix-turn-helix domain-containing protein [Ilumatobacteraceae bacterium]
MARPPVGDLLRDWRTRRRRSQMDLALDAGVSTRHLSFVETGRSRPSPELVLALAHHLEVPLRERNDLLLAAGYAPRFSQMTIDDPAMDQVRASIQRMLDAHDPYPGVAVDRQWNVTIANRAALQLTDGLPGTILGPPLNVYRLCLHPDGLARRTTNFTDWASYLLRQLRRSIALTGDPVLQSLLEEVTSYPNVAQIAPLTGASRADDPQLLIPFRLATPLGELSLFTTLTTFGTPLDVTVDELAIELFFPANDHSDQILRGDPGGSCPVRSFHPAGA